MPLKRPPAGAISGWYIAGLDEGYSAGYAQAEQDMREAWQALAEIVRTGATFAELERLRWGAGGRARFGEPRPGDYPGQASRRETAA